MLKIEEMVPDTHKLEAKILLHTGAPLPVSQIQVYQVEHMQPFSVPSPTLPVLAPPHPPPPFHYFG